MRRFVPTILSLLIPAASAGGQQIPDSTFHYPNPEPAYAAGYRVQETAAAFDASSLAPCEVLVIASAYSEDADEGRYPHTPTLEVAAQGPTPAAGPRSRITTRSMGS
ncbi:MAG: hypothetical protein R6U63_00145 [Longimicrobiales bacterium]